MLGMHLQGQIGSSIYGFFDFRFGGRTVHRKAQKKTKSLRSSGKLCQEDIEQMHVFH
jgi:hypothetical protein